MEIEHEYVRPSEGDNFSVVGTDVWRVIGSWCDLPSRVVLRFTAKSFTELLPRRPTRGYKLLSSVVAISPSLQEWFVNNQLLLSIDAYESAAASGNIPFLQYLWQRQVFHPQQIVSICARAAHKGQKSVLNWLTSFLELESFMIQGISYGACISNQVHVLDWLEARDVQFTDEHFTTAVAVATINGSFECLLWLWQRGVTIRPHPCAAASHHLEMLHWLVKNNYLTKQQVVEGCVLQNRPRIDDRNVITTLEEFYEPGVNYSDKVFAEAVGLRSLRVLKWLRKHKFPWDEETTEAAATKSKPAIMNYLLKKGCPVNRQTVIGNAVRWMNREMIVYLREQGYPWSERTVPRALQPLDFYQFLFDMDYSRTGWDYILKYLEGFSLDGSYGEGVASLKDWILAKVYV